MKVTRSENLSWVDSGLSCDTFNVIHITNGSQLSEREFFDALNYFRNKNFSFCIWISEENLSDTVNVLLEKARVTQQNTEPGMILALDKYELIKDHRHENIRIAETSKALRDFAEVIACNWTPPDENIRKYFTHTVDNYLDKSNEIFLAIYYHENKPVSVIEMFSSAKDTAGLYSLATLSSFRGQGLGSSLMTFALNELKTRGYKNVILQASEDGIRIYEKLGFRTLTKYYEFS
jgi:ribosomal protein S18 acetylase RimI-like enzyme